MLTIRIIDTERAAPPDKLADVELTFTAGLLAGLKLCGFAVWRRRSGAGYNVTFPARQYTVNGERRAFALLRPTGTHTSPDEPLKAAIIEAYERHAGIAQAPTPQPVPDDVDARAEAFPMLPAIVTPTPEQTAQMAPLFDLLRAADAPLQAPTPAPETDYL